MLKPTIPTLKLFKAFSATLIAFCFLFTLSSFSSDYPVSPPAFVGVQDGDADNDGILDFEDMDSDNDGILDVDEGVTCSTVDLSSLDGSTDALNDFNDAMITVGGVNGALIQIESPLTFFGDAMPDEFIISNEHILPDSAPADSVSLLLGVANSIDPSDSLGTFYTFSKPVCGFNFNLYDIDRSDAVSIRGFLDGAPVTFTIDVLGSCLVYDAQNQIIQSDFMNGCNVQARPSNGNVYEHYAEITFDGCIDRLEFTIFDQGPGDGGSFTFLPAPEPVCTALDTDGDGVADAFDLDSDNDGIPDAIEACGDVSLVLEECTLDSNGDGMYSDVPGVLEGICGDAPIDTDGDGIEDFRDLDSDGDGCPDATEACTNSNPNVNDTAVSNGYAMPAAAINDCGLVIEADGMTATCGVPFSENWLDDAIACLMCEVVLDNNASCMMADGAATVTASGGNIDYTYEWSNGETTAAATMLPAGMASVTVTDGCGEESICMLDIPEETCAAGISLVKTGTLDLGADGVASVGDIITYTFEVCNTSAVVITEISVDDPLVTVMGDQIPSLEAMTCDSTTFTGMYSITGDDIANGGIMNTAMTMGTGPAGIVDDTDDEMVEIMGVPGIEIMKVGMLNDDNGNGFAEVGESINYMFILTNTGSVPLTMVTVTDPIITVLGDPIDILDPGAMDNTTFTGTYVLTEEDIVNGEVTNTAMASGLDPNGNPTTDDDEEVTMFAANAEIMLMKSGMFNDENGDGLAQVGESITYSFTVINTGGVPLTMVMISDDLITVTGGPIPTLDAMATDNTSFTGTYILTQDDIDAGTVTNIATVSGDDPAGNPTTDEDTDMTDLPSMSGIDIEKSSSFNDTNGNGLADVGETINYSFIVTNTGNVTLSNIMVSDPMLMLPITSIATLAPGVSDATTISGTYTLTQDDVDAGMKMNMASVTSTDPDGNPTNDDDTEVTDLPGTPGIQIDKRSTFNDANGNGLADIGETITYSFVVTNTGNVTLTNIMVSDPMLVLMGNPLASLAPGASDNTTFSGTYTLTQDDVDAGVKMNMASITATDPDGNPTNDDDTEMTELPGMPGIEIVKAGMFNDINGDGFPDVGETITYMFIVTNTGNVTLSNVMVMDPLVTVSGGSIPSLAPGVMDNTTFSGTYTLTQADVNIGEVMNTASVRGDDPEGNPTIDDGEELTPLAQDPEIMLMKTGTFNDENGDGVAQPGETVSYVFVVINTGNTTLTDIALEDPSITVTGTTIPILQPGETDNTTFTGVYVLDQGDINTGEVLNTASVMGDGPDGNPVEDPDDEITPIPQNPDISVLKIGNFNDENGDGFGQPGETITFSFTVANTGNVTLTNVEISDDIVTLSGGPIPILQPGDSNTTEFSGIYTISQADIDNGGVMNQALATATDPDGGSIMDDSDDPENIEDADPDNDGDPDDPTVIPVSQNPMISLEKVGTFVDQNGDGLAQVGETIEYEFIITNTGNVTLTNVIITDPDIVVVGGPITSLAPGDSDNTTYSGVRVLTLDDLIDLEIFNQALVTGTDPNGMPITDISDDPTDLANNDPDGDGDPDDPTIVPFCSVDVGVIIGGPDKCLDEDGTMLSATPVGQTVVPTGFTTLYVLTSNPGFIIEQVSSTPDFTVTAEGVYKIHTLIAQISDPSDDDFLDLSVVVPGQTTATDVLSIVNANDICAGLDVDVDDIIVLPCIIELTKEQVFEDLFEDEDVLLTYDLIIQNDGDYEIRDLSLQDRLEFFPAALPTTPINATNIELEITNIDATQLPGLDLSFTGYAGNIELFDQTGILMPGESFRVSITTEVSLAEFRNFGERQFNQARVQGFAVSTDGTPIQEIEDDSDDPSVLDDVDPDGDGDPDDPTPITLPVCDELVCNQNLVFSLNRDCRLEVTPDMVLESPSFLGFYEIEFFNEDGVSSGNILTPELVNFTISYHVDCGRNSCWGTAIVETNQLPELEAPCACKEDGELPEECKVWCSDENVFPDILISPDEVREEFGECGPELLRLIVKEDRTGDICDPDGELITLTYTAKILRHDRIEEVDLLCQTYAIQKLDIDVPEFEFNAHFGFPKDINLDCDYLDMINSDKVFDFGSPESIEALTGSGSLAYPYYVDKHRLEVDTIITADTIQVPDESMQILRDTMVMQDVDGDGTPEWVQITVVDKVLKDVIVLDTSYTDPRNPQVPIRSRLCNLLVSNSDIEFEACGSGKKILREWVMIDWCDADILVRNLQTIEIRDLSAPEILKQVDGQFVPVNMLDDVFASTEPWTCGAKFPLPDIVTRDNCSEDLDISWFSEEGSVKDGYLVDLWKDQSPITVVVTVTDDCGNSTDASFNVIVTDLVPPVPVCEAGLQVSLTASAGTIDEGIAKIYATDLDEGSHDSGCGEVTLTVVRMEDWQEVVRDCQDNIIGYAPITCAPNTKEVNLGVIDNKQGCLPSDDNKTMVTEPGEFVSFCCEDAGKIVTVILIVTDENGNVNQCMVDVSIVDKSAPSLICTDQVITCADGDVLDHPAMLGGNCTGETAYEVLLLNEERGNNVCAGGQVVREWYVDNDLNGEFNAGDAYCRQIISVSSTANFDPYTIKWPKNYDDGQVEGINLECNAEGKVIETEVTVSMGGSAACTPDIVNDAPFWCDTDCGLVGYSMESDTIRASDACMKIIQRWTVVDWCTYDPNGSDVDDENDTARDRFQAVEDWAQGECASCPDYGPVTDPVYFRYTDVDQDGYYTYDQVIKVIDDSAPTIDGPADYVVNTSGGATTKDDDTPCTGSDVITATASDFCGGEMTGSNLLQWIITVSKDGAVVATKTAKGPEATMNSQVGSPGDEHIITWRVKDGCGNESSARTVVTFGDQKAPTPFCVSGLTTVFMKDSGIAEIWGREFDFGSFDNCTDAADLDFSIVPSGQEPIRPGEADFGSQLGMTFSCDDIANFVDLDVYVWDASGNGDFCTVGILFSGGCAGEGVDPEPTDSTEVVTGSSAMIAGQVQTEFGDVLQQVDVTATTSLPESPFNVKTDNTGRYAFTTLPKELNYQISVDKQDNYINGISTIDLVFMTRHVIDMQLLDSPYKVIAADVTNDGRVSALDIVEIKRLILGTIDDISQTDSWRFVDEDAIFTDETSPWPFTESLRILDLNANRTQEDFIAVKMGDVNGTASVNGFSRAETRSGKILTLQVEDQILQPGERIELVVDADYFKSIYGYQFTLNHPGLSIEAISSGQLDLDESDYAIRADVTTMSWHEAQQVSLDPMAAQGLFSIHMIATESLRLSDALRISSDITPAEAYFDNLEEVAEVALAFTNAEQDAYALELMQNEPNPFSDQTNIAFTLPQAGQAKLSIMDVTGQLIMTQQADYSAGYHSMIIDKKQLNISAGILYYQLEFNEQLISKKMILVE